MFGFFFGEITFKYWISITREDESPVDSTKAGPDTRMMKIQVFSSNAGESFQILSLLIIYLRYFERTKPLQLKFRIIFILIIVIFVKSLEKIYAH